MKVRCIWIFKSVLSGSKYDRYVAENVLNLHNSVNTTSVLVCFLCSNLMPTSHSFVSEQISLKMNALQHYIV